MKLIKPSYRIIEQESGINGIYKMIELAGRTCYKSSDKITEDSAKPFVDRMIKSGHGAMLEHGTVYLAIPFKYIDISVKLEIPIVSDVVEKYKGSPYTKWHLRDDGFSQLAFITTNYRVLVENGWLDDLKYLCEPTEYHAKRITVKFIMDRIGSQSFCRHRVFSFAQESTRYCNYSKDKFGNEVTFIIPPWLDITTKKDELHLDGDEDSICYPEDVYTTNFLYTLRYAERTYKDLLTQWEEKVPDKRFKSGFRNNPWTPQQARAVLPNALKTELVMTGFINDWKHFFDLRCATNAHPQAQELAIPLKEEFIKMGYINE